MATVAVEQMDTRSLKMLGKIGELVEFLKDWKFPVSASVVRRRLGVTERELRHIVAFARKNGYPIVSGNLGYKFGDAEEPRRCSARLHAHALDELARAGELSRLAAEMGKEPLFREVGA